MRIKQLQLQNFKRFGDLAIDLASSPKLVLLIGANGCGKSAIFDAFELFSEYCQDENKENKKRNNAYYLKKNEPSTINLTFETDQSATLKVANKQVDFEGQPLHQSAFYGRSAIRYLPRISRTSIGETIDIASNSDKPHYYIDIDGRFENDIDILAKTVLDKILKSIGDFSDVQNLQATQFEEVTAFLTQINAAFVRVFGENPATSLKFVGPLTPADGEPSKLLFAKGETQRINYDLLSSGEKEVVNILFNLFVRTPFYQDTIYYFDELDAHLHTSLQYNLLREITENWIPDNCQIWAATHSLGFIQYAKSSDDAVIVDFDNLNFDQPQRLGPLQTSEVFDIAVPKSALQVLFKDKKLIFCENQNAALLNSMGFSDVLFLGDIDKSTITLRVEQEDTIHGLIDRDYLSEEERWALQNKFKNLYVLDYYSFENYLYHPQNLAELYPDFDIESYEKSILAAKNDQQNRMVQKLDNNRNSYIFYKKEFLKAKPEAFDSVLKMIESNEFELFYKVFSMKKRADICKIHNLNAERLVQTNWFKSQMRRIVAP